MCCKQPYDRIHHNSGCLLARILQEITESCIDILTMDDKPVMHKHTLANTPELMYHLLSVANKNCCLASGSKQETQLATTMILYIKVGSVWHKGLSDLIEFEANKENLWSVHFHHMLQASQECASGSAICKSGTRLFVVTVSSSPFHNTLSFKWELLCDVTIGKSFQLSFFLHHDTSMKLNNI